MKKLVVLTMAIIMVSTITGCGNYDDQKTTKTYNSLALSTEVPTIYPGFSELT